MRKTKDLGEQELNSQRTTQRTSQGPGLCWSQVHQRCACNRSQMPKVGSVLQSPQYAQVKRIPFCSLSETRSGLHGTPNSAEILGRPLFEMLLSGLSFLSGHLGSF